MSEPGSYIEFAKVGLNAAAMTLEAELAEIECYLVVEQYSDMRERLNNRTGELIEERRRIEVARLGLSSERDSLAVLPESLRDALLAETHAAAEQVKDRADAFEAGFRAGLFRALEIATSTHRAVR